MNNEIKMLKNEIEYWKVTLATFITRIGDGIDMIAFSWLVYEFTDSTLLVALINAVNMIPNLTIGFVSGVLTNYMNEKKIMWICDYGRGILVSLVAVLYYFGTLQVWQLFVITFLNSSFEAFRAPAQTSIFPKIISEDNLDEGVALQKSFTSVGSLIGMCLAPLCIGVLGLSGALLVDAFSFILCGSIILTMKKVAVTKTEQENKVLTEIKEGFVYVSKDKLLLYTLCFACMINAAVVPLTSFQAAYMKDYLFMGSEGITIFGLGQVMAAILISPFIPKLKKYLDYRKMYIMGGALFSLMISVYGILPLFEPLLVRYITLAIGCFMVGVFLAFTNVPFEIVSYKRIEQDYLARYSAVSTALCMGIQPLSNCLFGFISNYIRLDIIYIIVGIICAIAFVLQRFNKHLYELAKY